MGSDLLVFWVEEILLGSFDLRAPDLMSLQTIPHGVGHYRHCRRLHFIQEVKC